MSGDVRMQNRRTTKTTEKEGNLTSESRLRSRRTNKMEVVDVDEDYEYYSTNSEPPEAPTRKQKTNEKAKDDKGASSSKDRVVILMNR